MVEPNTRLTRLLPNPGSSRARDGQRLFQVPHLRSGPTYGYATSLTTVRPVVPHRKMLGTAIVPNRDGI